MKKIIEELKTIFTKKQKIQLLLLGILICIGAFWELLGISAIVPFITAVTAPEAMMEKWYIQWIYHFFDFHSTTELVIFMAVALMAIYIVKNVYLCIMSYFQYRFTFHNEYRLSQKLLGYYLNRPYEFHLSHNSAELIRNIRDDVEGCYSFVLCAIQLTSEIAVCVVLAVFLLLQDKSITIGIVFLLTLYVLVYVFVLKKYLKKLGCRDREQIRCMNKWIMEALGGIKETKVLQRERYFESFFRKDTDGLAKTKTRYSIVTYIAKPAVETICVGGLLAIVAVKMYRGIDVSYFIPILSVFAVAAFRLLPSVNRITNYLSMLMFRKPSVDALYADLTVISFSQTQSTEEKEKNPKSLPFRNKICFENIVFQYATGDRPVLQNVSLEIPKNTSVAFIGPSGGGKTTLADVLLGLLQPQSGQILVDGKNIHEYEAEWYVKLGYIPQTIYLVDDTIKKNIAFGIPEEEIDLDRLQQAMEEAQIWEYVKGLPNGWDTMVGERGIRLSGGQRQRMGIARALYNDPEVLVLDEATSALDNETEKTVMEAIDNLDGKKTLIIIAHRLSTIKNCNRTYRVENGKVTMVDEGK